MSRDEADRKPNEPHQSEPVIANADEAPNDAASPQNDTEAKETVEVERLPQTFTQYDEIGLEKLVERQNNDGLREQFEGVNGLANTFKSDTTRGIEEASLEARKEQWGENRLQLKDPATFFEFLIDALGDRVIQILVVAAIISIIFGMTLPNPHTGEVDRKAGWIEGVAIIISVTVVVLVGSINNYQKAKKFEEMEKDQSVKSIQVIRDGVEKSVMSDTLQVGDLIRIETGMEMTCDCVVIKPQSLKMNESALTGEPDLVEKHPERNAFIISGTFVEEGNATAMVIAIGMRSYQGRLKGQLDVEAGETPLQEHLTVLADRIGIFGLGGAVLLILALSIKEIIVNTTQDGKTWSATRFLNFVLIAVALVAVAIPEGLPLAVTIALAFSMKAMMKDNCMVRVLASCETMGAATAVCSDKTGTLTKNEMTVVQGLLGEEEFTLESYGLQQRSESTAMMRPDAVNETLKVNDKLRTLFATAVALNSTADEVTVEGKATWVGNQTEKGMLKFLALIGQDYRAIRENAPERHSYPFSSAKKRMSTLVRNAADDAATCILYTKGASETVLKDCDHVYNRAGDVVALTAEARAHIETVIEDMANQGNRTIGVACSLEGIEARGEFPKDDPSTASKLVWVGLVGIQDPIREEVPAAVAKCHSAGLTVRMVTGDNIHTAIAIAKKCGLYEDNGFDHAMTGPEFREMSENNKEELMELLPRLRVLARSSPSDKHVLVGLLQEQGEVVAVTGDGTNDAPALKLADVGFAMNSGTDIAKGASAMVLLDDNFASVVNAIKWGRAVNDNVKKFLQFQLAINIGGVLLTIVGSLVSDTSKEPFTPVQLLWLNMIMDTLAALSLATELPDDSCLTREPVYKQAPLITRRMWCFILMHGSIQVLVILLVLFLGHKWFKTIDEPDRCTTPSPQDVAWCVDKCHEVGGSMHDGYCRQGRVHSTIVFNTFIWFQIFNVINARKIYGEWNPFEGVAVRSRSLLIIFVLIAGLQAIAVEFTGDFMSVTGLSGKNWGICIGLGAIGILTGIVQRFIPIRDYVPEEVIERQARIARLKEECIASRSREMSAEHPREPANQPPHPKTPADREPAPHVVSQ